MQVKTIESDNFGDQMRKIKEFRKRIGENNIVKFNELKIIGDGGNITWVVDVYYRSHLKLVE